MIFSDFKTKLKYFDWTLFVLVAILLILGLIIQYSLSIGLEPTTFILFKKQIFFIFLGLIGFFVFSFIDFRIFKRLTTTLYFLALLLLILVLFFGRNATGVRGWFSLGIFSLQPSEIVKIILIIILAKIWAEKVKEINERKRIIFSIIIVLPLMFLAFVQPDFGSALIFAFLWLFLASLNIKRVKYFVIIILLLIIVFVLLWFFILHDYQKARIISFLFPQKTDPLGRGYQISQAKIAIGAGRLLGRGIGYGSQGQMRFLPASRNDFIFAAFAEELGFLGSIFLIVVFILLFREIIKISNSIYDYFGFFLALGIGFNLFVHVIINISMNLGLLPVVGLSLPLISYGGSSMVMTLVSLGVIESVIVHQRIAL